MKEDKRRLLPSVDKVLKEAGELSCSARFSHQQWVEAIRLILQQHRKCGSMDIPTPSQVAEESAQLLECNIASGMKRIVNGTGIILHTGLGRAILPGEAVKSLQNLYGCSTLQVNLDTGERGRRDAAIESLMSEITGCEAATVVNNNAAATLLVLAALCSNREVIVSRGQLIEIGGSFRLPDVIRESGSQMVEVGTTNKTHLRDYENAINEQTAVLLHVNPSNYRIVGFSQQVPTRDLVTLKEKQPGLIVVDDLGCGALVDLAEYGLPHETTVQESLESGADVALFSGDKLIGGPQSGIIVGKKEYIERIRKHPLARALRVGKMTVAALEATLKLFLNKDILLEENPTLRMLSIGPEQLSAKAINLVQALSASGVRCNVIEVNSACGGGSLPTTELQSYGVSLTIEGRNSNQLARDLRLASQPVMARVLADRVAIDVRTLVPGDEDRIKAALDEISLRQKDLSE